MRALIILLAVTGLNFFSFSQAFAANRVALIVGNANYKSVARLVDPVLDANAIGQLFREAGFDFVDILNDVNLLDFKRALRKFEVAADTADIAVFYYAGHGIEIDGTSYLIPIDAKLASGRDATDEAVPLSNAMSFVGGVKKLSLIMLDASRQNIFIKRRDGNISSGLHKVEPTSPNVLVASASKVDFEIVPSGSGKRGLFAEALIKNLTAPGLDIRLALRRVREEVLQASENKQEPIVSGSIEEAEDILLGPPATGSSGTKKD
jgi:uncharacterized caspase-like protein